MLTLADPPKPRTIEAEVVPTALDYAGDWLHQEMPMLSFPIAKSIVMAVVTRHEQGKTLSPIELRILTAWRKALSEWRGR